VKNVGEEIKKRQILQLPLVHYYYYTRLTASFPGQPGQASTRKVKPAWILTGNKSVPIQLAQCCFPGLAISNSMKYKYIFQIKYTGAISSNSTRKLLWFEVTKMLIAVLQNKFIV